MKSIKIHKYSNSPLPQPRQISQSYRSLIVQDERAPLKVKLMSLIAQICERVETYSQLKLNITDNITKWLSKAETFDQNQLLKQFRIFALDMLDEYLAQFKNQENQSKKDSPIKLMRIKSQEKIRLKLIKDDQYGLATDAEQQKQFQQKDKMAHYLKQQNKKLEKKVLLLTVQFNKIKKYYEVKMQKYKKLLSSSLSNFQSQIQKQLYGTNRAIEFNSKSPTIKQNRKSVASYDVSDKYASSSSPKRIQSQFQKYGRNNQQIITNKFVTIPSIPIFQAPKAKYNYPFK